MPGTMPPAASDSSANDGWFLVGRNAGESPSPELQALLDEASAAVPPGFRNEPVPEMLPRRRLIARCRLCGESRRLTKEHIPPKASGTVQTGWEMTFQDYLDREDLDDWGGGTHQQGGIFGHTLCRDCNSFTGRHYGGAEYRRWALLAERVLADLPHPLQLDQLDQPLGWQFEGGDADEPLHPGSLVRQVLSCLCSLSGSWDLAGHHPEVRRIILEESQEQLSGRLQLGMNLYLGPHVRMIGPTLHVAPEQGEWQWLMEMAFAPFSFLCVLAANNDNYNVGTLMTNWTQYSAEEAKHLEAPLRIGFGWTPYPGDYRSRAEIRAGRPIVESDGL